MTFYSLLIGLALLLGWLVASRMVSSIDYRNSDFFTFYLAGWMNWQGQDPYSYKQWIDGHQHFQATWIPNPIFPYPLPLAIMLTPLGLLDLNSAYVTWALLSGVMIFLTCSFLMAHQGKLQRDAYLVPLLAGAFLFRPTLVTFLNGQLGAYLLFIIGCVILLWKRGAWFIGGLLLGSIMLKPSVGFLLLGFVAIWLIFQRRFSAMAGLAGSGLGLALIGFVQDSNWPIDFLWNSNQKLTLIFGTTPSLWGLSGAICRYQVGCTRLLGTFLVTGFCLLIIYYSWIMRETLDPLAALGIAATAAVAISPYIWVYDHILALIAVTATVTIAIRIGFPYLMTASYPILLAALSAVLVLVALRTGRDHWSVLVPLICLVALVFVVRQQSSYSAQS